MNEMAPTSHEPPVTYGRAKLAHVQHIYNTRVSYPSVDILTATEDVSACFRFSHIMPGACGAFSFAVRSLFCLTTALVFGSVISPSSSEPFRWAIEAMALVFFARDDISKTYGGLLGMITWEPAPVVGTASVQAHTCALNPGVLNIHGRHKPPPTHIFVDDCLISEIAPNMKQALVACIHVIFTVMGEPDVYRCPSPLAMDKWRDM